MPLLPLPQQFIDEVSPVAVHAVVPVALAPYVGRVVLEVPPAHLAELVVGLRRQDLSLQSLFSLLLLEPLKHFLIVAGVLLHLVG